MSTDTERITARIKRTEDLIVKYECAIDALAGGAESYTLDTGQSRQTVTKSQLGSLTRTLDYLESRLQRLENRLTGGASAYARPTW